MGVPLEGFQLFRDLGPAGEGLLEQGLQPVLLFGDPGVLEVVQAGLVGLGQHSLKLGLEPGYLGLQPFFFALEVPAALDPARPGNWGL